MGNSRTVLTLACALAVLIGWTRPLAQEPVPNVLLRQDEPPVFRSGKPLVDLPAASYVLEVRAQSNQKDGDVVRLRVPLRVR